MIIIKSENRFRHTDLTRRIGPWHPEAQISGKMTFLSIFILSTLYFPILDSSGDILKPPEILLFGFSVSLMITVSFLGSYARRIFLDNSSMNKALQATQVALEREKKLTSFFFRKR